MKSTYLHIAGENEENETYGHYLWINFLTRIDTQCSLDSTIPDCSKLLYFRTDDLQSRSFLCWVQNSANEPLWAHVYFKHYCISF